jgi:YVTN family beta-propeller protein
LTAVIDSIHWRLVSTLAVKGSYSTLVANPADGTVLLSVYDSNSQSQSLVAFDPISGAERRRARVGGDPNASILNSSGDRVFIANAFTNDVSVIDLRDMSPVATIRVGMSPRALALDENAGHLYVANYDSDNVHLIDTISNTVQATIPLAMLPTAILADENTARVYVANASTDSVFVLEEERLTKEIPVGRHPADLAWDEQSHRLLVANAAEGTLSIVDEAEWNVRTTGFITRQLTTVAVDPLHSRLFAGGNVFDLYTLKPLGRLVLHGNTVSSESQPEFVRVNPALDRIYAIGWNGIPGSNSRSIVYSVDGATLEQRTMLASSSNITAIAIDPATNRLYAAGTHPLAYSNDLSVYDLADTRVYSLTLPARTRAMALNPQTHHLFMGHETSYARVYGPTPEPTDQLVRVLDSTSFGEVVRLKVDSPRLMARIGNTIYVVSSKDGWVSLIQDLATPVPPSPTPTFTPTPWPSWTPTYTVAVPTRSLSHPSPMAPAQPAAPMNCAFTISPLVSQRWGIGLGAQLGCPMGDPRSARFAMQTFEHGLMFYRADDKYILVLAADKGWIGRFDTWQAPQPDDSCPSINPPQGLKPLHGSGKLWCSDQNIREKIGAGTSVEIGLYPAPTVFRTRHSLCRTAARSGLHLVQRRQVGVDK